MRAGGLGDVVLTLPAIRAVRRRFPRAQLEMMGHASTLAIVHNTCADRVSSVEDHPGLERLFARNARPTDEIAAYFSGFDLILWYGYDRDRVLFHNLRRITRGHILIVEPFPPEGQGTHASDHLLGALKPLGVPMDHPHPKIRVTPSDRATAAGWLGEYGSSSLLAVHPGSGSPAKNWAPDRYGALIRQLAGMPATRVVLLSGPADEKTIDETRRQIDGLDVLLLDALPLRVLAAVLERCAVYVGNDSGVTHLAAAVGVPTVAIFGPTDPRVWAPRGERVLILRYKHPSCSPCTVPRARACPDRRCLDAIEVEGVVDAVHRVRHLSGSFRSTEGG